MRQWLRKANGDLSLAQHLLGSDAAFAFGAVFHAQQAAEKALKAALVWHQIGFPKSHSIRLLNGLLQSAITPLPDQITKAVALTRYGVEVRYPADLPEPTAAEARDAVALAEGVLASVLELLPAEFREL